MGKSKKNYYDKGVKVFWLDEAEPEYTVYDFENYRYHLTGYSGWKYLSCYVCKDIFDGMKAEGQENIINLLAAHGPVHRNMVHWSGGTSNLPSQYEKSGCSRS